MIFDTHCHLNDEQIYKNIEEIIARTKENSVTRIIVPGWDIASSYLAIKIAEQFDGVYAAIGIHPENCKNVKLSDYENLIKLYSHEKVVAIGEIGLDYHYENDEETKNIQKFWFKKQIEDANKFNLPIIVHDRDAHQDTLDIIKANKPLSKGVLHCYSGSIELMKEFINLQMYIGIDGPVTFKNAVNPKEIAKNVPLDKLLVETDSPYMSPHPLRGTLNEPKNLIYIIEEIAKIKNINKKDIEEASYFNGCTLFNVK